MGLVLNSKLYPCGAWRIVGFGGPSPLDFLFIGVTCGYKRDAPNVAPYVKSDVYNFLSHYDESNGDMSCNLVCSTLTKHDPMAQILPEVSLSSWKTRMQHVAQSGGFQR